MPASKALLWWDRFPENEMTALALAY